MDAKTVIAEISERVNKGKSCGAWVERAKKLEDLYDLGDLKEDSSQITSTKYNIFYANTEILRPSLFSATPRPSVSAKTAIGDTENITKKAAAVVATKVLEHLLDTGKESALDFSTTMEDVVTAALVAGAGASSAVFSTKTGVPSIYLRHYESDRIVWGKGRKWRDIPWVAFGFDLQVSEAKTRYSTEVYNKLKESLGKGKKDEELDGHTVLVWQVWHKASNTVCEVTADLTGDFLSKPAEPEFKVSGFYPTPALLMYSRRMRDYMPVPIYEYYRSQAEELEEVTNRLRLVVRAIKVRGAYDKSLQGSLEGFFDDSLDNKLMPIGEMAALTESGQLDLGKAIWIMPIQNLITVATQLQQQRQVVISTIYEITGIGDLVRGASKASESATAQSLKDKWMGLRLGRLRTITATYIRDTLRIMLEIALQKMSPEQVQTIAGVAIPEEVMALLKSFDVTCYSLDIETDSTVASDNASDKQDMVEFFTGLGQASKSLELIAAGQGGVEAVKAIVSEAVDKFRFGKSVSAALDAIQAPLPPDPAVKEREMQAQQQMEMDKFTAELKHKETLRSMELASARDIAQIKEDAKLSIPKAVEEGRAAAAQQPLLEVTQQLASLTRILVEQVLPQIVNLAPKPVEPVPPPKPLTLVFEYDVAGNIVAAKPIPEGTTWQ